MRKNKGFTLVELLAVIVILAVIALIATPVVLSMIESSRKGAAESSMLSYTQATENTILTKMMNSSTSVNYDQTYSVTGLTLTTATVADGKVTANLPCLDADSKPVAAQEDGTCATGQTVNSAYLAFNIDLKGDQPVVNDGNVIKVDDNTVIEAKLKFGKYYVSYFYDKATGTTKYCSDDSAFITDPANCNAE